LGLLLISDFVEFKGSIINDFVEFEGIIGIPTSRIFVFNVHFDFPMVLESMDFNFLEFVVKNRKDSVQALELKELNMICIALALNNCTLLIAPCSMFNVHWDFATCNIQT
jgi:hypothetical protein